MKNIYEFLEPPIRLSDSSQNKMRVLLGTLAALLVAAVVTVSGQNQAQVGNLDF